MLLELKNVETYYGPIMAIRGVSLAVPEGRIVAVLGANGAGKTTILRTISGVMDPRSIADDLERVYDYFPALADRGSQPASQLSGGEQQMLAIGRALMAHPRMLLLDEPSLGLSPILVHQIFEIIKRINEEAGMTILVVEQNAHVALRHSHYGYVLENGRVVMDDTCEKLESSPDIQEFYLGMKDQMPRGVRRWKKRKTWR